MGKSEAHSMSVSSEQSAKRDRIQIAIECEYHRLYTLLDNEGPTAAVAEARRLTPGSVLDEINVNALRAAVFIDAGTKLRDLDIIGEGIRIMRNVRAHNHPKDVHSALAYNLANGITSFVRLSLSARSDQPIPAADLQEARMLYQEAADSSAEVNIKSASLTNQANRLKASSRWVEAYDTYAAAIHHDPTNAIALSGISNLLRWRMKSRVDQDGPLRRAAVRYLLSAYRHLGRASTYAGNAGARRINNLLTEFGITPDTAEPDPEQPASSSYGEFVRNHRLALCFTPEATGSDARRWDHLMLPSISGGTPRANERVPPIFALWNVLKSDFLAARWLAHQAIADDIIETGFYSDTLDYARYGTRYSALVLAQRAAIDLLDKVAVAAVEYFKLEGDRRTFFWNCWHVRDPQHSGKLAVPPEWRQEIRNEITEGNWGLTALSELAYDYYAGHLRAMKTHRNSGTHRLVVLHEMLTQHRQSKAIEQQGHAAFESLLIHSLQVARAALLYFHDSIVIHECLQADTNTGTKAIILVPPT